MHARLSVCICESESGGVCILDWGLMGLGIVKA